MWWSLPLRSLWRNRRRTLLSIGIISLGTAISFFVLGFLENSRFQIQETTVAQFGNLQVATRELWDDAAEGAEGLLPPDVAAEIQRQALEDPAVIGVSRELQFSALVAAGSLTQVVRVTSFEPENPALDANDLVVEGRGLTSEDTAAVLIGRSLANRLSVGPGDVLSLTLTTIDGAYNASPFRIAGVFRLTNEQVERQVLYIPLAFGQRLRNTAGVDRIIIALDSIRGTDTVGARLQAALSAWDDRLQVRTWVELSPIYRQLSAYFDGLFGFLSLAVTILVFFIILQVLTLAFLERTREIGTIRALGTTRGEVFRLFFVESLWLAVLGSLAGMLVGLALGLGFNGLGLQWRPPGTVEPAILSVQLSLATATPPFLIGLVATVLSSIFPALQTARIRVVDALRVG